VLNNEVLPVSLPGGTIYFIGVTMGHSSGPDEQVLKNLLNTILFR